MSPKKHQRPQRLQRRSISRTAQGGRKIPEIITTPPASEEKKWVRFPGIKTGFMAQLVSLGIVFSLIITLGLVFYQVVAPFFTALFLAGVLALLCQPLQNYFVKRFHGKKSLAAMMSTSIIVLSISLPTVVGITLGSLQLYQLATTGLDELDIKSLVKKFEIQKNFRRVAIKLEELWPSPAVHKPENSSPYGTPINQSTPNVPDPRTSPSTDSIPVPPENGGNIANMTPQTGSAGETGTAPPGTSASVAGNAPNEEKPPVDEAHVQQRIEELKSSLQQALMNLAQSTLTPGTALTTFNVLSNLTGYMLSFMIFIITLYYFFAEGSDLLHETQALIPVNMDQQKKVFERFGTAVRAVVMSTMMAAIGQGLATSLAIWCLGFGNFFILTIAATFAALIPIVGTSLVWLPCAVILFFQGQIASGVFLCLYGTFFVGTIDNLIRAYVLQSDAKLHPLLALISVLGGIQAMGLWGVILAPIVASCLHALLEIFNEDLRKLSKGTQAPASLEQPVTEVTPAPTPTP